MKKMKERSQKRDITMEIQTSTALTKQAKAESSVRFSRQSFGA